MQSLLFLGTGPGTPVAGRFCSSCLVHSDDARILVDAGEPCSQRLVSAGVSAADLDAVLVTHGHSDHIGGLPMLVQTAWLAPRKRPLPVWLPRELIGPLRAWLDAVYLPSSLLGFPLELNAWNTRQTVSPAAGIEVSIFPTTHLRGLQRKIDAASEGRFEIFGLDINCRGRRVIFSSDLGAPSDLEAALSAPCDVLVCELSHFRPEDLFGALRGRTIGQLVFNHLAPGLNGGEEDLVRAAREALPEVGKVTAVRDGDRIEF